MSNKKQEIDILLKALKRELSIYNGSVKNRGLLIILNEFDMAQICEDIYMPDAGWREIHLFFTRCVKSKVNKFMMEHPEQKGVLRMSYDCNKRDIVVSSITLRWPVLMIDTSLSTAFSQL